MEQVLRMLSSKPLEYLFFFFLQNAIFAFAWPSLVGGNICLLPGLCVIFLDLQLTNTTFSNNGQ